MRIARQLKDDRGARFIPIHGLHATFLPKCNGKLFPARLLARLCALSERPQGRHREQGHEGAGDEQRRRGLVALAMGGPVVNSHGIISPQQASCSYRNSRALAMHLSQIALG